MKTKDTIRKLLRSVGYDVGRYHHAYHPQARRNRLLKHFGIDTVLDIGANTGQFAGHLREDGYSGKIVSFEPLIDAFAELERSAQTDPKWSVVNIALGDSDGSANINVAGNSCSSSLLGMLPEHKESAPESVYQRTERIEIRRLDGVYREYCGDGANVYMKVDTQGYGMEVLKGAGSSLAHIRGVQMEVSLVPLYENEPLVEEMVGYLRNRGLVPMSIEPGFGNKETGQLLQADFVFYRP